MICAVPDRVLIARNLRSAMSAFSRSTEQGDLRDLGAACASSSGLDFSVFNAMVLSEPVDQTHFARLLDEAARFFHERRVGWSCWLDESMVTGRGLPPARLLEMRGLSWTAEHEGMVAHQIGAAQGPLPQFDIRPVTTEATREDFWHICADVFLLPYPTARGIYGSPRFWSGMLRGWVGYDQSRPICIAIADADEGSVGLYSVATLPAWRRRGYGEAITRHALDDAWAHSGLSASILQATPAGLPMYRRMGYQARSRVTVWSTR